MHMHMHMHMHMQPPTPPSPFPDSFYYVHEETGATQWENPAAAAASSGGGGGAPGWQCGYSPEGVPYYYHAASQTTQWEARPPHGEGRGAGLPLREVPRVLWVGACRLERGLDRCASGGAGQRSGGAGPRSNGGGRGVGGGRGGGGGRV